MFSALLTCKSRRCVSGKKMGFHYVASHLFLLLMDWLLVRRTAVGWIKSPITLQPTEVKFSTLARKLCMCQSDADALLSLALTVNHTSLVAIPSLLSTHTHTHKFLCAITVWIFPIGRVKPSSKRTLMSPTEIYVSHIITAFCVN